MEIDLGKEEIFIVKKGGKTFEMREPSVVEVQKFQKELKGKEDLVDHFIDFVDQLGFPKDEAKALGIRKMNRLIEGIVGGITEKK